MRLRTIRIFGAATLVLGLFAATSPILAQRQSGMGAQAQPGIGQPGTTSPQNTAQTAFVAHMRRNSMVETNLSKMALKNSDNAQVKDFARQVISENRKSDMAMSSANESSFGPSATPTFGEDTPSQTRKAEKQMKKMKGTQFDEMYLSQMNGYIQDDQKATANASDTLSSSQIGSLVMQLRNTADARSKQLAQVVQSENLKLPS